MVSMIQRLARCKTYREEALKHPIVNKLYIEDLDLSIAMFEQDVSSEVEVDVKVQEGWADDE